MTLASVAILCSSDRLLQAAEVEQRVLTGPEIRSWLGDHTAFSTGSGEMWVQYFSTSGDTPYWAEGAAKSDGSWSVRGNEYCSKWPPNGEWSCYTMRGDSVDGVRHVVWISPGGFESHGRLKPGFHPPKW